MSKRKAKYYAGYTTELESDADKKRRRKCTNATYYAKNHSQAALSDDGGVADTEDDQPCTSAGPIAAIPSDADPILSDTADDDLQGADIPDPNDGPVIDTDSESDCQDEPIHGDDRVILPDSVDEKPVDAEEIMRKCYDHALEFNDTEAGLNSWLTFFRERMMFDVRKDARTILNRGSRTLILEDKGFTYIGIKRGLEEQLEYTSARTGPEIIWLTVNTDGLPMAKSTQI